MAQETGEEERVDEEHSVEAEGPPWASPTLPASLEGSVMKRLATDRRYLGHPRRDWLIAIVSLAAFALVLRFVVAALRSQVL